MARHNEQTALGAHRLAEHLSIPAGAQTAELKVVRFRPHARRLVFTALVCIAVSGAFAYFAWSFVEEWQNWLVAAGAALIMLFLVLVPYLRWLTRSTTITTRRVIIRSGVLTQHRTEVSLAQVSEIKLKRGLMQRITRAGDIILFSTFGSQVVLRDVPNVTLMAAALQELAHWQHRG